MQILNARCTVKAKKFAVLQIIEALDWLRESQQPQQPLDHLDKSYNHWW